MSQMTDRQQLFDRRVNRDIFSCRCRKWSLTDAIEALKHQIEINGLINDCPVSNVKNDHREFQVSQNALQHADLMAYICTVVNRIKNGYMAENQ